MLRVVADCATYFSEESLGDRVGFLFFTTMFWVMTTWFNALFACT
jgi:hypothetical protein